MLVLAACRNPVLGSVALRNPGCRGDPAAMERGGIPLISRLAEVGLSDYGVDAGGAVDYLGDHEVGGGG